MITRYSEIVNVTRDRAGEFASGFFLFCLTKLDVRYVMDEYVVRIEE